LQSNFVQVNITPNRITAASVEELLGSSIPILSTEAGQTVIVLGILCSIFAGFVVGFLARKKAVEEEEEPLTVYQSV
jgi:hypothetical protein